MTLQEAKELKSGSTAEDSPAGRWPSGVGAVLQSMLQQGNPFVRISTELARKAERAHKMLLKQEKQQDHAEEPEGLF